MSKVTFEQIVEAVKFASTADGRGTHIAIVAKNNGARHTTYMLLHQELLRDEDVRARRANAAYGIQISFLNGSTVNLFPGGTIDSYNQMYDQFYYDERCTAKEVSDLHIQISSKCEEKSFRIPGISFVPWKPRKG